MFIEFDSPEENALFDALLFSDYDERLASIYIELGLRPDDNNTMHPIG